MGASLIERVDAATRPLAAIYGPERAELLRQLRDAATANQTLEQCQRLLGASPDMRASAQTPAAPVAAASPTPKSADTPRLSAPQALSAPLYRGNPQQFATAWTAYGHLARGATPAHVLSKTQRGDYVQSGILWSVGAPHLTVYAFYADVHTADGFDPQANPAAAERARAFCDVLHTQVGSGGMLPAQRTQGCAPPLTGYLKALRAARDAAVLGHVDLVDVPWVCMYATRPGQWRAAMAGLRAVVALAPTAADRERVLALAARPAHSFALCTIGAPDEVPRYARAMAELALDGALRPVGLRWEAVR